MEEGDKGGMSGWLDGSGFDKLSKLAETAAQTAAAAKADAEARLIASLNADAPQSPSGTPDRAAVARPEGEASGLDFSTLPRKDLEELCTKRSEKLKQAVQKIRAQQEEYMRVQRDYEQLQQIVRADSTGAGGTGDDAQQLRIDLQAAQDRSEALRKDKAELQRENEGLTTSLASTKEKLEKVKIKSQELLSKFKTQMAEKDETQKGLEDRIQQLLQQLPHAESSKQPKQEAGQATCCASLRAELESTQKKLEQANISASAFEAKGKDELRRLQDDSAAAIEAADRRAVEQLERAQAEHLEVLQLRQQLEQAIPQQRDELGACSACEQMAGELRSLETARAAADEALLMLQKSSQQKQDDLARKLESQRARADEAVARVEEELAACQNQVAEWQTRARELEEAAQQEAEGAEAGRGRVKELQEALESCRKELDACKTEHEAVQAQHVVEVESLRAEVSDREAKMKEKTKTIIEAAKEKYTAADEARKKAVADAEQYQQQLLNLQQTVEAGHGAVVSDAAQATDSSDVGGHKDANELEITSGQDSASVESVRVLEEKVQAMKEERRQLKQQLAAADENMAAASNKIEHELASQRARADEAVARVEEELAACQNQVAEWQTRARELEEAAQQEAEGAEAGRGRVKELQEALESCRKELDACKTEHEAVQAQHVVEVESLRAEVSDRNATLEACREEIAVLKSKHDMELEELKQGDKKIKEKAKVVIEQAKTKAKQAEEEKREALEAVQQLERERDALQQQHSVMQQQHLALENQEVAAASSAGADPVAEMEQMRHELNLAHEQLRAKEEQTRTIQAEQIKVQHELHEAQKRADDSVNAAAVAQEELLGKISDLNDKCARFYQDREDARDVLADAQAAGSVYKKALLTVTGALKSPVMLGREMNFSREASRLKQVFAEAADSSTHLKDAEGMLVVLAVEELELAVVEALEFAASRSNAWQEARRALEGDVSKGEKRCRQLQDKLDAKNKEVINLMEALKTAEHNESATAGKGEGKGRTPRIDGKCFPPVLHRVWADGTAWALLGGVGEDGEADWYCESSIRAAFTGAEGVSGGEEVLERVGTPWLLEELPLRERKLAELTAALEKKQNELVAIQEEYRAYKIKAHSVLRKKEASAPVRDEDAEAARRRAEIQEAVDNQRAKMAAQIKDADERAASARQDVDVLEGRLKEAGDKIKEQEHRMQVLQEKVCSLEEELCSAAQREREWDQEKLERERKWKQEQEELGIELERGRKKEGVNEEEEAVEDRGQTGHTILVLQRRVASLEQEVETAKEEAKSVSQALEASKEKAQAMLIEKDAVIASLRTRLKSVGMTTGEAGHGVADAVDGLDAVGGQFSLMLQSDNTFILGNEDNSDGKGTARHLHFAPLERAGLDRRPSTETQEEHILHVAQMQAQQSEYVASLLEKISILKDNVSEGKRLQDLLCRERDQLRDALEVMKREVTSTQRLERYNSKFREGTNIEYLKNVLLKFIETQDDKLIPVLSSVLEFDSNEQRRLKDAQTRLSSPWSKIGKGLGGALF